MAKRTLASAPKDRLAKLAQVGRPKKATEGREIRHTTIRLPVDLIIEIKVHCAAREITIQDFLTEAAEAKLKKDKA